MSKFASKPLGNDTSHLFCCWKGTRTSLSAWCPALRSFMKALQQLLFHVLLIIHDPSQQTHQLFMGECVHSTHRFLPDT